jgi:hypothetical protein
MTVFCFGWSQKYEIPEGKEKIYIPEGNKVKITLARP